VENAERLLTREDLHAFAAGSLLSVVVATILGLAIPPTLTVERQGAACYYSCGFPDVRLIFVLLGLFLGSFALGWWAWRKRIERPKQPRPTRPLLSRNWREVVAYMAVSFTAYLVGYLLVHAISDRVRLPGGYYGAEGSPVDVFVIAPASIAFVYVLVVAVSWPTWGAAAFAFGLLRRRLATPGDREVTPPPVITKKAPDERPARWNPSGLQIAVVILVVFAIASAIRSLGIGWNLWIR
jgi:hypothetical protein